MVARVQIKRTSTPGSAPASGSLQPGELAIEMDTPTRLWVGVPAAQDATLQKLLLDLSAPAAMPEPVGIGTWGRLETGTWQRFCTVGDAPPVTPVLGDLWWDSLGGSLFLWYTDPTSSQWVPATPSGGGGGATLVEPVGAGTWGRLETGAWQRSVAVSGDLMTGALGVVDALSVEAATGTAFLELRRPAGQTAHISGNTGLIPRWTLDLGDALPETGADAGSDFRVSRFNDAGTLIDAPLTINRATGITEFPRTPTVLGVPIASDRVLRVGDTMSGPLTVACAAPGWSVITLSAPAGAGSQLTFSAPGGARWGITGSAPAGETGANAGSNLDFTRYDDTGAWIGAALSIIRASGAAQFYGPVRMNGFPDFELTAFNNNRFLSFGTSWSFVFDSLIGNCSWTVSPTNSIMWMWRITDGWSYNALGPVCGIGAYIDISDERGKVGIVPATAGLAAILQLNPINFTRIAPRLDHEIPQHPEIGFSAQQVQLIIPEAVRVAGVPLPDGSGGLDDAEPSLGIATTPIVAALVNAIKELNARLTAGGL